MLFYVLIDIWWGLYTNAVEAVISVMCIFSILLSISRTSLAKKNQIIAFTIIGLLYLIANYLLSNTNIYYATNLMYVLKCVVVVVYFSVLHDVYPDKLENTLISISKYLNLYMVINIAIMFLQLNESYFLIDKARLPAVVYYPDYIAGLFGINGTHRLSLFSIFLLCFDLYIYKYKKIRHYKFLKPYLIVVSVLLLFMSTQNDNNTFIILYPLFLGLVYCTLYTVNLNRILKIMGAVIVSMLAIVIVVSNKPELFTEISKRLGDIISVYVFRSATTWDERSELLQIALTQGRGYYFGSGFGSVKMYSDLRYSTHWGMNSLMTFVYFMGIIPLLLYVKALFDMIMNGKTYVYNKERIFIKICLYIATISLVQYCQLLSEINLMILYSLIMCVFRFSIGRKYD